MRGLGSLVGNFGTVTRKLGPCSMLLKMKYIVGPLLHHAAQPGLNKVLFAHALLGPLDRDVMIASEGLHPVLVVGGPLAQQLFAHHRSADDLAKEEYDLLWA